jgi:DNA polymerase-3 subunit epsilon
MIIVFFDTETTGLPLNYHQRTMQNTERARLVQLSYSVFSYGKKLCSANMIIKPENFTIPKEVERIHGISTEKAKREGVNIRLALEPFVKYIENADLIIAHNVNFDMIILHGELDRLGYDVSKISKIKEYCTMLSSTEYVQAAWNSYYENYKWPKLIELAEWCGIDVDGNMMHNALYDLRVLEKCFFSRKYQKNIVRNKFFNELESTSKPISFETTKNRNNNNDDFDDDIPF